MLRLLQLTGCVPLRVGQTLSNFKHDPRAAAARNSLPVLSSTHGPSGTKRLPAIGRRRDSNLDQKLVAAGTVRRSKRDSILHSAADIESGCPSDFAYTCAQEKHPRADGTGGAGSWSLRGCSRHLEFKKSPLLASGAERSCLGCTWTDDEPRSVETHRLSHHRSRRRRDGSEYRRL